MSLNIRWVGLAGDGLHDESEDNIAAWSVFKAGPDRSIKRDGAQTADKLLGRFRRRDCW